jgi:hypothetical protein
MSDQRTDRGSFDDPAQAGGWVTARTWTDFAAQFTDQHDFSLLGDPRSFWVHKRQAQLGPITILDVGFGTDIRMECGQQRSGYFVNVPMSGQPESVHRGSPVIASPGSAALYWPQGDATVTRWATRGRTIVVKIERGAVDDALSEVLGREIASQIDFTASLPITTDAARNWTNLLRTLNEQHLWSRSH